MSLFVTGRFGEGEAAGWRVQVGSIDMEPKEVINNGSVEILMRLWQRYCGFILTEKPMPCGMPYSY